jgi:aminoglycoside phosphotransferase (APT) family kinase protein
VDTPFADIEIDPELVARLIQTQHPDLAGRLTLVANGWDNAIYRLGDDLCVRLPRRQVAVELILNEQRWLPMFAGRVGVRIPAPVRIGVPSLDFPWPWTIAPWFEGQPAANVSPSERGAIAADLAEFMAELHIPAPSDAPHNPVRGVPLAARTSAVHQRLSSGAIPRADELRETWDRLAAVAPWTGPPLWLHGDPHPANILLRHEPDTNEVRLSAVLDFGDLTGGDPATDLAAAWLVFNADARCTFRAHVDRLTGIDQNTWARARGWALNVGTAIAMNSNDSPHMAAIGRHALDQVLMESY